MNKRGIVNAEVDEPLVAEGIKQAEEAAHLIPKSVRYIYTSPLQRAVQTAEVFASVCSLPVIKSAHLTEVRMGSLAGHSWEQMPSGAELKKLHRSVRFNYQSYGGESLKEVTKRLKEFMDTVNKKYADGEVLIVTHGGIIRVLNFLESRQRIYETEKNTNVLMFHTDKILA
jgi:broad specificity phosphatase PhoE